MTNSSAKVGYWAALGTLVFSIAYAIPQIVLGIVFVSIVYFINLTVVAPRMVAGDLGHLEVLRYAPRTLMTGIDALGYTSMSLATLFAAPAFDSGKGERWIKRLFLINGALAPIILATQVWPNLAYAATPWLVAVPGSSLLLTLLFRREMRAGQGLIIRPEVPHAH